MVFCVVISWVDGQKYENLPQFNTNWERDIILVFALASAFLTMSSQLLKRARH